MFIPHIKNREGREIAQDARREMGVTTCVHRMFLNWRSGADICFSTGPHHVAAKNGAWYTQKVRYMGEMLC